MMTKEDEEFLKIVDAILEKNRDYFVYIGSEQIYQQL